MPRRGELARRAAATSPAGVRTITPTSGWSVLDVLELVHVAGSRSRRAVDLVGRHHPRAARAAAAELRRRARPRAAASAGSAARAAARRARRSRRRADGRSRPAVRRAPAPSSDGFRRSSRWTCSRSSLGSFASRSSVELRHRARVEAARGRRAARRRRPAAGGLRLQAGDAAGRVHEHVGGGQQVGHLVGEAVDVHARLAGEGARASFSASWLVAPGEADDARDLRHAAELAHGALDVADAPAAAGDDHHPSRPRAARARAAPRAGSAASRNSAEISGRTTRALPRPAIRSTAGTDSP